jgi:UDP-glucose-4-epimerase GalE
MAKTNKTVIITGAQGFIGSHTAKVFKEAGWYVVGIDRTPTIPESTKYIDKLITSDFVDSIAIIASAFNAAAIIHCAGTSLVGPSITNPAEYYQNNSAKTNQMMQQLSHYEWHGIVVFSSSAAVYGIPSTPDCITELTTKQPINPYGMSKLMCEHIISDSCRAYNIRGIALRYFNAAGCDLDCTIGHVQNDTHMIPRVLHSHHVGIPFNLYGNNYDTSDGTCIRDYLHVTDIANAHLESVNLADKMRPNQFDCFNLGTGIGYSNKDIIDACEVVLNNRVEINVCIRRDGDPPILVANGSKFQSISNWKPVHSSINTIIQSAWNWHTKQYGEMY